MSRQETQSTKETAKSRGKGGHMASLEDSTVADSLEGAPLPALADSGPTNLALVYAGEYVPETVSDVLRKIENRDVVLVARGGEIASYWAAYFAGRPGLARVVNRLERTAWTDYLRWLGNLTGNRPKERAIHLVTGLDPLPGPDQGKPFLLSNELTLQKALELAPRVLTEGKDEASPRCPAAVWLEIPLDQECHWRQGDVEWSGFDVPSAGGLSE